MLLTYEQGLVTTDPYIDTKKITLAHPQSEHQLLITESLIYGIIKSRVINLIMRVLVACEFSGIVRNEFTKLGFDATSCDIEPTEIDGKHYQGDVRDILYDGWDLMIAHPPCRYISKAGARYFKDPVRQKLQIKALKFFLILYTAPIKYKCLENPVGVISTYIRKPDQYIQPYEYGHGDSKKTGLWLKNLPLLKPTDIRLGRRQKILMTKGSGEERRQNRSRTYLGIAEAIADQYGNYVYNKLKNL